jgi:hypothetical protein
MSDEYTLAEWSEHPYTSYDKRSREVRHRIRIIRYSDRSHDVLHQRSEAGESWKVVEAVELREHGMLPNKIRDGVLSE